MDCMKNTRCIKQVATVIAGYTFRKALSHNRDGRIFVLQAKNILDDTIVAEANLEKINFENFRTVAGVMKGDVVISARGSFYAGVIRSDLENTIAASSVYIVRLNSSEILPEYLAIYFNSATGQKIIRDKATGAVINTILKKDLENIPISFPPVKAQKEIIDFYQNSKRMEKLLDKKKILINQITENIINTQ